MKQLKGLPGIENAFRTISKREQKIYNDFLRELKFSATRYLKSHKKGIKTIDRFSNAFKNLVYFEMLHFSDEHKKQYKKQNRCFSLLDALTSFEYESTHEYFSSSLNHIYKNFAAEFHVISGMYAKGYLKIN